MHGFAHAPLLSSLTTQKHTHAPRSAWNSQPLLHTLHSSNPSGLLLLQLHAQKAAHHPRLRKHTQLHLHSCTRGGSALARARPRTHAGSLCRRYKPSPALLRLLLLHTHVALHGTAQGQGIVNELGHNTATAAAAAAAAAADTQARLLRYTYHARTHARACAFLFCVAWSRGVRPTGTSPYAERGQAPSA